MNKSLLVVAFVFLFGVTAGAAPVLTLGPPVVGEFSTISPGSIRVDMLEAGDVVDLAVVVTIHPVCIRPILLGLEALGDGGTFSNLTGTVENGCGGDQSVFNIRFTGDGLAHAFDIAIQDAEVGALMFALPVELFPDGGDADGDGIADAVDNCIEVNNSDQRDTDSDNIGNACDPDVALPNDCIVNVADLGVYKQNFFRPGNLDTDNNGDGITNALDLGVLKSLFFAPPGPSGLANACTRLGEGELCNTRDRLCGENLSCCYPCGIPGCENMCTVTCTPDNPLCVNGCIIFP